MKENLLLKILPIYISKEERISLVITNLCSALCWICRWPTLKRTIFLFSFQLVALEYRTKENGFFSSAFSVCTYGNNPCQNLYLTCVTLKMMHLVMNLMRQGLQNKAVFRKLKASVLPRQTFLPNWKELELTKMTPLEKKKTWWEVNWQGSFCWHQSHTLLQITCFVFRCTSLIALKSHPAI